MRTPHVSAGHRGALAPLTFCLSLLTACGSDGQAPSGSGGARASGGAPGTSTGGASGSTGGSSGSTGGAQSGGATASGGSSGATGGAATGGSTPASGGATASGGRDTGGAPGTGGAAGGSTATGGRSSGGTSGGGTSGGGTSGGTFTVTSPLWTNMPGCAANMSSSCSNLPTVITRSGAGTSPELHWTGAPATTKSFAVVMQDLSGNSTHWVLWNIPASVTMLPANVDRTTAMPAVPAGAQQCGKGTDAATKFGYIGPGAPCNVYEFRVYAVDVAPFTPSAAACATTTDAAAIRTQLSGLGATLLGSAAILGRTNMTCN